MANTIKRQWVFYVASLLFIGAVLFVLVASPSQREQIATNRYLRSVALVAAGVSLLVVRKWLFPTAAAIRLPGLGPGLRKVAQGKQH